MITREEWLRQAVFALDTVVFAGDLDLVNRNFQISCGRCPGRKLSETVQPDANLPADQYFPTTIHIDFKIVEALDIMTVLCHECIKAFIGSKGKAFKKACEKYYFESPYKEPHPSAYLKELIEEAYNNTVQQCGEWPGIPVAFPEKETKKSNNKVTFFCPECGWEVYTTKKQMKNRNGYPTCMCGAHMGIACDEEEENVENKD